MQMQNKRYLFLIADGNDKVVFKSESIFDDEESAYKACSIVATSFKKANLYEKVKLYIFDNKIKTIVASGIYY